MDAGESRSEKFRCEIGKIPIHGLCGVCSVSGAARVSRLLHGSQALAPARALLLMVPGLDRLRQPAHMSLILIVDDEANYRKLLRACLENAGHEVLDLGRGSEVVDLACALRPDAILLDFELPDELGIDVCRSLKANAVTSSIPVIMVTGRTGEQDRVDCFEAGADDFVGKPFSLRELLLRVRVLVQRRGPEPHQVIRLGALTLDIGTHRVHVGGVATDLTRLELALLRALCARPARVLSRDELLDGVWGIEAGVDGQVVDSYVSRLRQKLGQAGGYIRTIRGAGYRLDPAP